MTYDVFLSHSSKDKAVTDAVCNYLESQGISCWVAPRNVRLGESYATEIVRAITASRAVTLIFSSHANQSKAVQNELECAFSHGVTIFPLRVEDVPFSESLEFYLGATHWLDAMPPDEGHFKQLATALKNHLNQGDTPPAPAAGPRPTAAVASNSAARSDSTKEVPPPPKAAYPRIAVALGLALAAMLVAAGGYWLLKSPPPNQSKSTPTPTRTPGATRAAETRPARAESTRPASARKTTAPTSAAAATAKSTAKPSSTPAETQTPRPANTPQDSDKKQVEQTPAKQISTPTPEPVVTRPPVRTPVHTQSPSPQAATPAADKIIKPIRRSGGTSISAEAAGAVVKQLAAPQLQRK